ncbi:MAG: hypothetical protein WAM96_15200 [Candidatus Acidiferrales bacterium]
MRPLQRFAWLGAGFVLGIVLAVSYDFERFIPMAAAFGLLCFISGILLMQFFALRKQEDKADDLMMHWFEENRKLDKERAEWQAEREAAEDNPEKDT